MKYFFTLLFTSTLVWAQPPPPPKKMPPKPLHVPETRTTPDTEADGAITTTDETMPVVPNTNTRARRLIIRPANTTLPTPTTPNTPRPKSPSGKNNAPPSTTVPNTTSPNTPPSAGGQ